jgi:hypothetical protein
VKVDARVLESLGCLLIPHLHDNLLHALTLLRATSEGPESLLGDLQSFLAFGSTTNLEQFDHFLLVWSEAADITDDFPYHFGPVSESALLTGVTLLLWEGGDVEALCHDFYLLLALLDSLDHL